MSWAVTNAEIRKRHGHLLDWLGIWFDKSSINLERVAQNHKLSLSFFSLATTNKTDLRKDLKLYWGLVFKIAVSFKSGACHPPSANIIVMCNIFVLFVEPAIL